MKISKLNCRVKLYKPIRLEDECGGASIEYSENCQCWAEFLRPGFNRSTVKGDAGAQIITQGIRIRHTEISRGWRIKYGNHTFEVLHVDTSKAGEIILTTQEVEH